MVTATGMQVATSAKANTSQIATFVDEAHDCQKPGVKYIISIIWVYTSAFPLDPTI